MEFSNIQPEDFDEVYNLIRLAGINSNLSLESWRDILKWMVEDNPYRGSQVSGHVLTKDNKIIASHYYCYHPFKLNNKEMISAESSDFVVHPNFRGMTGILFIKNCVDFFKNKVWLGMDCSESTNKVFTFLGGFSVPLTDRSFSGVISGEKYAMSRLSKYPLVKYIPGLGTIVNKYFAWKKQLLIPSKKTRLPIEFPFDLSLHSQKVDKVCTEYMKQYELGIIKSYAYLQWRYLNHPFSKNYHFFGLNSPGNELVGIGILQLNGTQKVFICELIYISKYPDIESEMLNAAITTAKDLGGATIHTKFINQDLVTLFQNLQMECQQKKYEQFVLFSPSKIRDAPIVYTFGDFKRVMV